MRRLSDEGGWAFCEGVAGEAIPCAGDLRWREIPSGCAVVAAALRQRGEWSVDAAPWPFDDKAWWYRFGFDHDGEIARDAMLQFDGLATFARIWLNGALVGESGNMFAACTIDVSQALRQGRNELVLEFEALAARLVQRRPRPRWRVPMLQAQQLRWIRTTLLGRTPGWSPPAPPVGPWRDILLLQAAQYDVDISAELDGDDGVLRCRVYGACASAADLRLRIAGHGGDIECALKLVDGAFQGELRIPGVAKWWPHTHGDPALYTVSLSGADGESIDTRRVGFRSVAIDTSQDRFSIVVNGVAVFCRGACWTPLDAVSLRSSIADCGAAVAQVREAGMNMLRVAGTMVYEEDHFYQACDEQGVMVWQDFMFANMDYPTEDAAFRASVDCEATQQLKRWGWRASIAVLCGNSEVAQQAAMWGAPREQWQSPLFDEALPALCAQHAPATPYWTSSAHGGAVPFQADAGTTSYYGVGAYLRPLDDARRSGLRFATECLAFSNVPADGTIARMPGGQGLRAHHPAWKARVPRDLGAGWDFEDVRDHYLRELTGFDPVKLRSADHARYFALSRWVSGEVMARAYAEWRRPGSPCGGALVLFLRDLWPAAGWGLLDDRGTPKPCWHALASVLQPRAVLLTDEGGNGLYANVINEPASEFLGVLAVQAWRNGHIPVAQGEMAIRVPPRSACSVPLLQMLDHFIDLGYAYRFGPAPCDAVVVALRGAGGELISRAFHFPEGVAPLLQQDPGLAASFRMVDARTAEVTIEASGVALGVSVDAPGFAPEREGFQMAPGEAVRIVLRADRAGAALHGQVHALNSIHPVRVTDRGG